MLNYNIKGPLTSFISPRLYDWTVEEVSSSKSSRSCMCTYVHNYKVETKKLYACARCKLIKLFIPNIYL
jgi:hypothetical protein